MIRSLVLLLETSMKHKLKNGQARREVDRGQARTARLSLFHADLEFCAHYSVECIRSSVSCSYTTPRGFPGQPRPLHKNSAVCDREYKDARAFTCSRRHAQNAKHSRMRIDAWIKRATTQVKSLSDLQTLCKVALTQIFSGEVSKDYRVCITAMAIAYFFYPIRAA